jgi:hypothetical protein
MTLSNMLLADQTRDKLMAFPQHEAIIGFTHASKAVGAGPVHRFPTSEAAIAAWKRGELRLTDNIEIDGATAKTASDSGLPDYALAQVLSWLGGDV